MTGRPARRGASIGRAGELVQLVREATLPVATGRARSVPASLKPRRLQRACSAGSSGTGHLDGDTALVPGRAQDLLDECVGDRVHIVARVDDQEVDGAHEAAGPDRRPQGEDGHADDRPSDLGDEDARLGDVDELPEQVRGDQRAVAGGLRHRLGAQCDEPIDVRDPSRSNLMIHADGCDLARYRRRRCEHKRSGSDRDGPTDRERASGASVDRSTATWGTRRPRVAIDAPGANIRHRFGGHLRAARISAAVSASHRTDVLRDPWLSGPETGTEGRRTTRTMGAGSER